jgi:phospholipid-translocating ATPase
VVLIDLAKLWYTFWIEVDANLWGIKVQSFSLHDDLAQIDYLFCDKTGTLTQNELRFRGVCLRDGAILNSPRAECSDQENLAMFLRCICLCHDLTRVHLNGDSFLTGSSQDELVLCEMVED